MSYQVRFSTPSLERKFGKLLSAIPQRNTRERIMKEVEALAQEPRPAGKKLKALKPPLPFHEFTAHYRIRIGDYRVLYDVDDGKKLVWILALARRTERTYT